MEKVTLGALEVSPEKGGVFLTKPESHMVDSCQADFVCPLVFLFFTPVQSIIM
jgi:hypothetical protein